jgi:hypothetical protein
MVRTGEIHNTLQKNFIFFHRNSTDMAPTEKIEQNSMFNFSYYGIS